MSQEISIQASQLVMPSISGTVSVPLAELDRMRIDHANAIKLAQELERHQAEVRVIYMEVRTVPAFDYSTGRYTNTKTENIEKGRDYKGFDEFKDTIRQEEYLKLEKEITTLQKNFDAANSRVRVLEKTLIELEEHKKNEEVLTLKLAETEELLKFSKELSDSLNSSVIELRAKVKYLEEKKGFWGFLTK